MMKKNAYSVKSFSVDAIVSCVLAGISLVCQLTALLMSYSYAGKGPRIVGLMGIASFLMACSGLAFCRSAWKSPDGGVPIKRIAGLANGSMILVAVVYYVLVWI